jgi:hypothetical protein
MLRQESWSKLRWYPASVWTDDLGEIGWDGRDWIELTQDRDQWRALVNTMMNLRVP